MKRFSWPLQRVLDVTHQKERMLRAELFNLAREIASLHRRIFIQRASLRSFLVRLDERGLTERIDALAALSDCIGAQRRLLDELHRRLGVLQQRRREAMQRFKDVKRSRRSMDKLRQRAFERYRRQLAKAEQKQSDESAWLLSGRVAAAKDGASTDEVIR